MCEVGEELQGHAPFEEVGALALCDGKAAEARVRDRPGRGFVMEVVITVIFPTEFFE